MEVDSDNALLSTVAAGGSIERDAWPGLRREILTRLDKIAHHDFPIPNLPPPPPVHQTSTAVEQPSSPSQEANKENAPAADELPATRQPPEDGVLPKQIVDMLSDITSHLQTFRSYPPHTIQRLAELILYPRQHYRALASYLHAVDRVAQVTSGTDTYPLPPAIPDMSSMSLNGEDAKNPAVTVAWSNPANNSLGTDEALGGALLTPIPWLTRRSPEGNDDAHGAQIHSESTETIDGPNGMGSIETVSVSVNGVPSTGHTRGITQGELLRQEQRAGVVPVSQLSRAKGAAQEDDDDDDNDFGPQPPPPEEEEAPHARGPEEIGVDDTGPQASTTSHVGEGGLEMRDIDVEAAVGRKHDDDEGEHGHHPSEADGERARSPGVESVGSKREAEDDLDGEPSKKVKEDEAEGDSSSSGEKTADDAAGDKMDTGA